MNTNSKIFYIGFFLMLLIVTAFIVFRPSEVYTFSIQRNFDSPEEEMALKTAELLSFDTFTSLDGHRIIQNNSFDYNHLALNYWNNKSLVSFKELVINRSLYALINSSVSHPTNLSTTPNGITLTSQEGSFSISRNEVYYANKSFQSQQWFERVQIYNLQDNFDFQTGYIVYQTIFAYIGECHTLLGNQFVFLDNNYNLIAFVFFSSGDIC